MALYVFTYLISYFLTCTNPHLLYISCSCYKPTIASDCMVVRVLRLGSSSLIVLRLVLPIHSPVLFISFCCCWCVACCV